MKKKGGDLLGNGSYGCVYKTKPLNSNIKEEKLIKILFDNKSFINEVMRTLLINKIDNGYVSPILEGIGYIEKNKIEEFDEIKKCSLYDKYKDKSDLIYQIIFNIQSIGVDLHKILKKENILLDKILVLSIRLYESLELYNKYNIVHNDIKPDNIVYLEKNDKLIFIDFGLMKTYLNIFNDINGLKFDYLYYPPEYKLLYSLYYNETFDDFKKRFLINFQHSGEIFENLIKVYPLYENDLKKMYNYYNKRKSKLDDILDLYTNIDIAKIDIYSLSISLYETIIYYLYNLPHLIKDKEFIIDFVLKVILPTIKFNNRERLNISETLKILKSLKHSDKELNDILHQQSLTDLIYKKEVLENPKK